MAESRFGFDLNVRLEDDDDGNLPLDLNEHEGDDGNAGFDLNEPEDDEHGNGTTSSCLVHVKHHFFLLLHVLLLLSLNEHVLFFYRIRFELATR